MISYEHEIKQILYRQLNPISVAALSQAWIGSRSIAGSNPVGGGHEWLSLLSAVCCRALCVGLITRPGES